MKKILVSVALLALFSTEAIAQQATPPAKAETTKEAKHHKKKKYNRQNGTADAEKQATSVSKGATDVQSTTPKKTAPTY